MSDAAPDSMIGEPAPRPSHRRILLTAALSVALHLLLIGLLLLPPRQAEPAEPPAINVDLVRPEVLSSSQPPPSEASSQALPSSAEASSSAVASSDQASSELASSAEISSAEPSSAEAASSAQPSSQAASDAASAASSTEAPTPQARPIVIPVAPSEEPSQEASSAADQSASEETSSAASGSNEASALTTTDTGASNSVDGAATSGQASSSTEPPPITGALHAAKRFYLDAILSSSQMARARDAIKKLPPEKRLAQTCNIEAVGQLGAAGRDFQPDAIIADAFAKPAIDGPKFTVSAGAFRSRQKWYAFAYECTLSRDMGSVKAFTYRIGGDVTATLKPRLGG